MSVPQRRIPFASVGHATTCAVRLRELLEAYGIAETTLPAKGILATMTGWGSWASLAAAARRQATGGTFDEELDVGAVEERLEGQVNGLLHRVPDLDADHACRIVAELRASAHPDGVGRRLGPCAGSRFAYRGRDGGAALFLEADGTIGTRLLALEVGSKGAAEVVAMLEAACGSTDVGDPGKTMHGNEERS